MIIKNKYFKTIAEPISKDSSINSGQRTIFSDFTQNLQSFENSLNSVQKQAQKQLAFVYSDINNKKIAEC